MALFKGRSLLWRWLADQPPYVEVGIGMFFVFDYRTERVGHCSDLIVARRAGRRKMVGGS